MYSPNFCAECGAQILRARRHFWTSGRFCDDCARRFRKQRILLPLFACAALFTSGLLAGRAARTPAPPLVAEGRALPFAPPASSSPVNLSGGGATRAEAATHARDYATQTRPGGTAYDPPGAYAAGGAGVERAPETTEVVSICGARTQKGTPCQRRVRGTGRCWQHLGMPAMLPDEKRLISGR